MINARVAVRDGRMLHHSEQSIADDANKAAQSLIERTERRYPIKLRTVPVETGSAPYSLP
jgi:hypothetical protein